MASIQTAIQLTDRVTAPLRNITSAVTTVINEFERVQGISGKTFNTAQMAQARAQLGMADTELKQIATDTARAKAEQSNYNSKVKEGKSLAGGLLSSVKSMVATFGGLYVIRQGSSLLSECSSKASQLAQSETKLGEVMRAMQGASASQVNGIKNLSAEISGYGVVGKSALINGAQQVSTYFHQTAAVEKLLPKMADLAVQMHGVNVTGDDMVNIGNMFGKVMTGQVGALRRAGISFDEHQEKVMKNGTEMQKAAMLAQVVEQNVGQMNRVMANTPEGVMARNQKDFAGVKTTIGQQVQPALVTFFNSIHNNLPTIQLLANGFAGAATIIMKVLSKIIGVVGKIANFFTKNWSVIEPIIWGIVAALVVYNATMGIGWLTTLKDIAAKGAHAIASGAQTVAIIAMTVAQEGLNAALALCPLTWIIIAIIAVIAVIYAVVAAINKAENKTISATGVIFGAVASVGAAILNIVIGVINGIIQMAWSYFVEPFIGIIEWVLNVANGGFDSFGGAVANLIGQIISWFLSLGKIVTKIIDAIFGTDWTAGLTSLQDSVTSWGKNDNAITLSREAPQIGRIAYKDAYNAGYGAGKSVENKVSDMFSFDKYTKATEKAEKYDNTMNAGDDSVSKNTKATADSTSEIADKLDVTSDQLKYIREYAERQAVSRFTTSNININMTNNNNMSSDADVDGIMNSLKNKLQTQMNISAEGV